MLYFLFHLLHWRCLKEFYTRNIKPCSLKVNWVKTKICSILSLIDSINQDSVKISFSNTSIGRLLLIVLLLFPVVVNSQYKSPILDLRNSNTFNTASFVAVGLINPNDCINCFPLIGGNLSYVLQQNLTPKSNTIFIMPKMREVEKNKFLHEEMRNILAGYTIITSDDLYTRFLNETILLHTSAIIIYDINNAIVFADNYKTLDKQKLSALK